MTNPSIPLSAFIRRTLTHHKMTYRELADAAVDPETGEQLDYRWLNGLVRGRYSNAPTPARLRAIAAGLRVPPVVVKRLAAQQFLELEEVEDDVSDDAYLIYLQVKALPPQRQGSDPRSSGPSCREVTERKRRITSEKVYSRTVFTGR
jgi:transcriptional regulator with XRE-family HTH domain